MLLKDYTKQLPNEVYIFGSGSSLDLYAEDYWDGKFTVGINKSYQFDKHLDAVVLSHGTYIEDVEQNYSHLDLFVSRYDSTHVRYGLNKFNDTTTYVYDHYKNTGFDIIPKIGLMDKPEDNKVITCGDTVCRAIGVFVHLGAKNIWLVGCDGVGNSENKINRKDYYPKNASINATVGHAARSMQSKLYLRDNLKKYGVNIKFLKP
tara:strand:- start:7032 stop:7646 length:615 start_codon:yes stop_codon:yes gene_type:complete